MLARLMLLLLVAAPALALAAEDPMPEAPIAVVAQPKPAPVADAATAPAPQPAIQSHAPPTVDPSACRMTCAQTYYFCQADAQAVGCGGSWSQCVNTCNTPSLDPDAAPAP
jgi:hypothetical protein